MKETRESLELVPAVLFMVNRYGSLKKIFYLQQSSKGAMPNISFPREAPTWAMGDYTKRKQVKIQVRRDPNRFASHLELKDPNPGCGTIYSPPIHLLENFTASYINYFV